MGLFPPRIPASCQRSKRDLVPGVHTFSDISELSASSRTQIVENARTFQYLIQGSSHETDSTTDISRRLDIDDLPGWPTKRWCFVREGLSSSTSVSRIVATGACCLNFVATSCCSVFPHRIFSDREDDVRAAATRPRACWTVLSMHQEQRLNWVLYPRKFHVVSYAYVGALVSLSNHKLELHLLHYDLERPEAGVQVLEALMKEFEQDPDMRAFTFINDAGEHTTVYTDLVVRAVSTVDAAVHRFVREHKFMIANEADDVPQDATKQFTFILRRRAVEDAAQPKTEGSSKTSVLQQTNRVRFDEGASAVELAALRSPERTKVAPTPHCTPAVLSKHQKHSLHAKALCSALNSLPATKSELGPKDLFKQKLDDLADTLPSKKTFKRISPPISPPTSPPFCVPQHVHTVCAVVRSVPTPVASLKKLTRSKTPSKTSDNDKENESTNSVPPPPAISTLTEASATNPPAQNNVAALSPSKSPRRRCTEALSPSAAARLKRNGPSTANTVTPLAERNWRSSNVQRPDTESTDPADLLKRMEILNRSLQNSSRRANELDFENMETRAEIATDEVSRMQEKSWQNINRRRSVPVAKTRDSTSALPASTASSDLDSLEANPLGMHEILNTLSTLSDAVVQLKKDHRSSSRFAPAEETREKVCTSESENPAAGETDDTKNVEANTKAVQTDKVETPKTSLDDVLKKSPRHTERINALVSKLHKQFGFPFEAILAAARQGSARSDTEVTSMDEFDLIQTLFARYFGIAGVPKGDTPEVDIVHQRLEEETALRAQSATYDKCTQEWTIPLSIESHSNQQTQPQESCTLHCFVQPPHHGTANFRFSAKKKIEENSNEKQAEITLVYPHEVPPMFVESDCGRFEGSEAEDIIRELVTEACNIIQRNSGAPFLLELSKFAAKLVSRRPFSETAIVPRPLQSYFSVAGFQRGVVSTLSALPQFLGGFFERQLTGDHLAGDSAAAELSHSFCQQILTTDDISITSIQQPIQFVLNSLMEREARHIDEISQLELKASDLRGQIHVLQQLRATQAQIEGTVLTGTLWKRVGSRVGKGHTRQFELRGALLSWSAPPGSVEATSKSFVKQLTHSKKGGQHAMRSSTKTFQLDANTAIGFVSNRGEPLSNQSQDPQNKENAPSKNVKSNSLNVPKASKEPSQSLKPVAKPGALLSPVVHSVNTGSKSNNAISKNATMTSPRKPSIVRIGKRRTSFSRTSNASTSRWSALSTQTLLRSGADKLSSKMPDHAFFIRSNDRELVLHAESQRESTQWINALQDVITLLQEVQRLESQVDEIHE